MLHELPEGVAGVLAPDVGDEFGNDDSDDDGYVGDTPDVGDELGNALRVRLGLKLVALGFQEHFDVLRILQNFHFDIGLIDCNVSITKTSMRSSGKNRIPCSL